MINTFSVSNLETICQDCVEKAINLYKKCKSSYGDGITTNGERNFMRAEITQLSKMYCSAISLIELQCDATELKWVYFEKLIEPNFDKTDPELGYFLKQFQIS
jgi:hypothetical protein